MSAAEEAELARWGIWTPSGSVTPREYLASEPPADQVKARLDLLLGHPERYRLLALAFAEYLGLGLEALDALYTERHPRRGAPFAAERRARGEHSHAPAPGRAAPPPVQEAPQAMTTGESAAGHGEHVAETAGEHPEEPTPGERRHTLSPETGAMLRAARGRCGLSVRQSAVRLHLAVGMVSMMESGTRAPSLQVADRLVTVYELTGDEAAQLLREAVPGTGRDYRQTTNGR